MVEVEVEVFVVSIVVEYLVYHFCQQGTDKVPRTPYSTSSLNYVSMRLADARAKHVTSQRVGIPVQLRFGVRNTMLSTSSLRTNKNVCLDVRFLCMSWCAGRVKTIN